MRLIAPCDSVNHLKKRIADFVSQPLTMWSIEEVESVDAQEIEFGNPLTFKVTIVLEGYSSSTSTEGGGGSDPCAPESD